MCVWIELKCNAKDKKGKIGITLEYSVYTKLHFITYTEGKESEKGEKAEVRKGEIINQILKLLCYL